MEKLTLKKQPKEEFALFELPVRGFEDEIKVWNGEEWIALKVKDKEEIK